MKLKSLKIKKLYDCKHYIPELARLWYEEISRHWVPEASINRASENLVQHANLKTMPLTLVATKDNEAIGMASLRINDGIRPDLMPWLGSLVVNPFFRKQQVGEALIDATKKQAKEFGFPRIFLLAFDLTIPCWYKKLGWEEIGMDTLYNHPVTVMQTST